MCFQSLCLTNAEHRAAVHESGEPEQHFNTSRYRYFLFVEAMPIVFNRISIWQHLHEHLCNFSFYKVVLQYTLFLPFSVGFDLWLSITQFQTPVFEFRVVVTLSSLSCSDCKLGAHQLNLATVAH